MADVEESRADRQGSTYVLKVSEVINVSGALDAFPSFCVFVRRIMDDRRIESRGAPLACPTSTRKKGIKHRRMCLNVDLGIADARWRGPAPGCEMNTKTRTR